ncbi:MAG: ATP-dependent helicase [Desulfobacterales bacterium]|nr:ATP-dependent helicase [Desulfobacterales bacterium]
MQLSKTHTLGFAGGLQGYRLNSLKDVYFLYAGLPDGISDAYIKGFDSYGHLRTYAEAVEDIELLSICKVVENYGGRLPKLIDAITEKAMDADKAQITLTTAHKAKGLQWPNVLMLGDFLELVKDGHLIDPAEVDPDEFNLIYVAMTRTIFNLRFDKESALPAFIKIVQEQKKQSRG